ncbi:hypothetical protein KJ854_02265 [Patescibacteria group bacterium]|nr:hypothetical protein [Patescibacteria group bacterium]
MKLKSILNSEFKNPEIPKKLFGISSIIALFFLAFKAPLDPDLFWHLKTGELMRQYKIIPQIDWYSYTMSDFPWIDHEWLTEILMYLIKNTFGWIGLAIFFAAIVTFIFAWLIPKISRSLETKKSPFYTSFILTILGAIASSLVFGARPQVLGLLGVALILYIIKECQINNKSKIIYFLPFLFLLWANMHASFILGLVLLGVYLALDKNLRLPASRHPDADWVKLYRPLAPEAWKNLSRIALLAAAATFINPYGAKIYMEIARTFSDSYGHNLIIEWLSPNFHTTEGIIFSFYLIFLFIVLCITKKIDLFSFVLLPFLLFFSLQAARNIPFFILISLPVLIRSLEGFEEIFSQVMQKKFIAISLSILLIFFPPFINETKDVLKTMYNEKELASFGNYPSEAALAFLGNYRAENSGNILTDYFWGGYLIANDKCQMTNDKKRQINCEPKVFIDGRMAHWITPERHILKDYNEIIDLKNNSQELLDKYQIKAIFYRKDSHFSRSFSFNSKWRKIYEDDLVVIYEKKIDN